jgi:hypothetical protein
MDPVQEVIRERTRDIEESARTVATGSMAEGIAGAAAIALTIIGLAGTLSTLLLSIAIIAVGAGLAFQGASIASRFSDLLYRASQGRLQGLEFGAGMSAEILGGAAGIALGILALVGVAPLTLSAIAAIVLGGGVLIGSSTSSRLNMLLATGGNQDDATLRITRELMQASVDVQLLIGLASIALGILALLGLVPLYLTLIAMLSLGFSVLMGGTAVTSRMMSIFRRY